MTSRFDNRTIVRNQNEMYKPLLKKRGIKFINQYKSATLSFPTPRERASLKEVDYAWKAGDKYFKLAHRFYGDASLWWIIAWYNHKPTEADVRPGQVITIPLPLDAILPLLMRRR